MARINITVPDEMARRARETGLNISAVTRAGLAAEFERQDKIAAVNRYLAEQDALHGPPTDEERARAKAWGDRIFGPESAPAKSA